MTKDIRLQSNLVACEELNHNTPQDRRGRSLCCEMTKDTLNWSDTTCLIFYLLVRTV
jgi:hypothetical protein